MSSNKLQLNVDNIDLLCLVKKKTKKKNNHTKIPFSSQYSRYPIVFPLIKLETFRFGWMLTHVKKLCGACLAPLGFAHLHMVSDILGNT